MLETCPAEIFAREVRNSFPRLLPRPLLGTKHKKVPTEVGKGRGKYLLEMLQHLCCSYSARWQMRWQTGLYK